MASSEHGLYRIAYDSVVALPGGEAGEDGLQDIIAVARSRNAELGITGVLYFDGAYFVQILEGPRAAVRTVVSSILFDQRHKEIKIAASGPVARREFQDWTMALVDEAGFRAARSFRPFTVAARVYKVTDFVAGMRARLGSPESLAARAVADPACPGERGKLIGLRQPDVMTRGEMPRGKDVASLI